jgi:hypothetical protein
MLENVGLYGGLALFEEVMIYIKRGKGVPLLLGCDCLSDNV